MFSWLKEAGSSFVWRKVFSEHPALLELMLPGNEQHLALARSKHPKLDDAINRFGLPPQSLIKELLNGPPQKHTINMNFDITKAVPQEQLGKFFSDGYLHIRNAVSKTLVSEALRHINASIGRGRLDRSLPGLVMLPPEESAAAPIVNLFAGDGSALPTLSQCLIGIGKVRSVHAGQVALRFPRMALNSETCKKFGGRAWHVDGFGQGQHSPFTLLVGVCLSETPGQASGNFAVHPGAHWTLQQAVKDQVTSNSNTFSRFENHSQKPDLGEPVQLLMKPGDVVLAHQKLPHLGCENYSPNIRYQVYFRIQHVNHLHLKQPWLDDLMLPFEGVRAGAGV